MEDVLGDGPSFEKDTFCDKFGFMSPILKKILFVASLGWQLSFCSLRDIVYIYAQQRRPSMSTATKYPKKKEFHYERFDLSHLLGHIRMEQQYWIDRWYENHEYGTDPTKWPPSVQNNIQPKLDELEEVTHMFVCEASQLVHDTVKESYPDAIFERKYGEGVKLKFPGDVTFKTLCDTKRVFRSKEPELRQRLRLIAVKMAAAAKPLVVRDPNIVINDKSDIIIDDDDNIPF